MTDETAPGESKGLFGCLRAGLFEPVDSASLAVFRMVYGAMAVVSAARFFWYGWIDRFFYERGFFFHFPGFEWVEPLPSPGMHVLFAVLLAAGVCIAIGLFYRVSLAVFVVGFTYVGLVDTTNYLNHYWAFRFIGFLMLFMPMARTASVDSMLRAGGSDRTVPAWSVWTLRFQLGLIYFFAGVAKLQWDWLVRGQPIEIWLQAKTHLPVIGPWLAADWVAHVMSVAGAVFDLSIFFFLLSKKTRCFAYPLVVVFHAATGFLFNIGMFPIIMIGLTLIFFEPDWPRKILPNRIRRIFGPEPQVSGTPDASANGPGRTTAACKKAVVWGLGIWFSIQVFLPMRHLLYPGDVSWTQEGFRFAWRVKIAERGGYLKFRVSDPDSGDEWVVHPSRYLTNRQVELASVEPTKILQLAHHIDRRFGAKGYGDVEVRADAFVSLNGRPSRRLVDPGVDLSEKPRSICHKDWILSWSEVPKTKDGDGRAQSKS